MRHYLASDEHMELRRYGTKSLHGKYVHFEDGRVSGAYCGEASLAPHMTDQHVRFVGFEKPISFRLCQTFSLDIYSEKL